MIAKALGVLSQIVVSVVAMAVIWVLIVQPRVAPYRSAHQVEDVSATIGLDQAAHLFGQGQQGQLAAMHQQMFARDAVDGGFVVGAMVIGLDTDRFKACLGAPSTRESVSRDLALGERLKVNATPSFFLGTMRNGEIALTRRITGGMPFSDFEKEVRALAE